MFKDYFNKDLIKKPEKFEWFLPKDVHFLTDGLYKKETASAFKNIYFIFCHFEKNAKISPEEIIESNNYGQFDLIRIRSLVNILLLNFPEKIDPLTKSIIAFKSIFFKRNIEKGIFELNKGIPSYLKDEDSDKKLDQIISNLLKRKSVGNSVILYLMDQISNGDMRLLKKKIKIEIVEKLSLVAHVGDKLSVKKETRKIESDNSKHLEDTPLSSLSEIAKIPAIRFVMPIFKYSLALGNEVVENHFSYIEKKQKIIMLIDRSASMMTVNKMMWVCAMLVDRMFYVKRGVAELQVSTFFDEKEPLNFFSMKDEGSTEKFSIEDIYPEFIGGMTNLQWAINETYKIFENKIGEKDQPELLIINDGEDQVGDVYGYKKINTISLGVKNPKLKSICEESGGVFLLVEK